MDADKLYNRTGSWGDNAKGDGAAVTPAYLGGVDLNALMLGRSRWTSGATVLQQPDCEAGAFQIQPVDRLIRTFRIPGTSTADDAARFALSTPHRATWHHADHAGLPPLDLRVCKGDLFVRDTGNAGEDRYLMAATHADGDPSNPTFYGLATLAQYRTAATLGAKTQHSDRSTWRASSWGGSALDRDFRARSYVRSAADASDIWEWRLSRLAAGGTERDVVRVTSDGELRVQGPGGGQPALLVLDSDLDAVHATAQVGGISCTSFAPDQAQMVLVHGTAARRLSWQFRCPTDGFVGLDALAVQLSPALPADEGAPYLASPTAAFTGSYLTEGGVTGATFWAQHQLDSADPTGRLRFANTYGDGVLDLHSYGRLALAGTTVLSGDLAAGNAGAFTSTPTYSGAHAVATHALLEAKNPTLSGGATLGDAVLVRYDANPGTHKGLDAAAGGANAWGKRETPAGLLYEPLFTSKDLGIPAPVYGEMSLTDGSAAMTVSDGPDAWNPLAGFDTEGAAVGAVVDLVNGAITPVAGALFEVSLSASFEGDDATEYVLAVAEVVPGGEGPPTFVQVGRQARVTTTAGEVESVCVECLLDVTTGSALVPVVKSPTGASVALTLREAAFTIVKRDDPIVS